MENILAKMRGSVEKSMAGLYSPVFKSIVAISATANVKEKY